MAKGLVPPDGLSPTTLLNQAFGADRVACLGGPAHAREMVTEGAGLVAASSNVRLAAAIANVFMRAGVVCEQSNDPVGVELSGVAKNAASLAAGATAGQGLNAAGAAAGHIFAEVWRYAERQGGKPESMIGLAGTGDLVGTALAPQSRNRRAGELLGQGVPAAEIPARIGQAVEALDMVPLLATALRRAHVDAPVTTALHGLISGELPLDEWVARVRATVPPPAVRDNALEARRGARAAPSGHRVAEAAETDRRPELEHELRAATGSVGGADAAAVLLGDLADDRQPEAGARAPARGRAAVEAVEQVREILRVDAGPVVAHAHAVHVDAHLDDAALRRVLGRVVEQVVDRAREPLARALDDGRAAGRPRTGPPARAGARGRPPRSRGGRAARPRSRAAARRRGRARSGRRRASRARSSAPRRPAAAAPARRRAAPRTPPAPRCWCAGW